MQTMSSSGYTAGELALSDNLIRKICELLDGTSGRVALTILANAAAEVVGGLVEDPYQRAEVLTKMTLTALAALAGDDDDDGDKDSS